MPDYTFEPYDVLQTEVDGHGKIQNRWLDYATLRTPEEATQAVALVNGSESFRIVRTGRKVVVYPITVCGECGQETASDEGICYECQCDRHGTDFDMDGAGWVSR